MKSVNKNFVLVLLLLLALGYFFYKYYVNNNKVIYENSFNSKKDISKITGHGEFSVKNGNFKIIGNDMGPSGMIQIPFNCKQGYYKFSMRVKSNLIGRSDVLMYWATEDTKLTNEKQLKEYLNSNYLWSAIVNKPLFRTRIQVKNKWIYFESINYLSKPKNSELILEFNVGGYVAGGTMQVDYIKLEKN